MQNEQSGTNARQLGLRPQPCRHHGRAGRKARADVRLQRHLPVPAGRTGAPAAPDVRIPRRRTLFRAPSAANWGGHHGHVGSNVYANFNLTDGGDLHIGSNVWIGGGSRIKPGITIGVPCRVVREISDYDHGFSRRDRRSNLQTAIFTPRGTPGSAYFFGLEARRRCCLPRRCGRGSRWLHGLFALR